jgi:hypothetical protein
MWMQFDQFAKSLLDTLLRPVGTVRSQHEVRSAAQAVDLWFEPAPERAAERARLGPLARVSEDACMLEPFHQPPGLSEVRACIRKQYNLAHWQEQEARAAHKTQESRPPHENAKDAAEATFPRLWIISAGRPETVLARYEMRSMDGEGDGWLPGFWRAADGHALHVVVLRDLPETLDTVLLRLLGAGRTHRRAVIELGALPRDSWQYQLAMPLLLAFRFQIPPGLYDDSEDDMQYTETLERLYAEWEQRVLDRGQNQGLEQGLEQGMEQGLEQGWRKAFVTVYQARFGAPSDDLHAALALVHDEDSLQRLTAAAVTLSRDQVDMAVQAAASAR